MICSANRYNIYKIKENEMGKERCTVWRKNSIQVLMRKPGGKKPPERPRPRWEISIKIYHK